MLQIKDEKMSDDDADDFIAFGKALKPLEDDAIIRKKPIAVEEQIGNTSLFLTSYSRLCTVTDFLVSSCHQTKPTPSLQFETRMASDVSTGLSQGAGRRATLILSTPHKVRRKSILSV